MKRRNTIDRRIGLIAFLAAFWTLFLVVSPAPSFASEERTATLAKQTLSEIMEIPGRSIPEFLFEKAEGVAIFPNMVKGGFILGAQRGKGILVVKNDTGDWENPRFVVLSGGSLGFQAGIQKADVVLVFCTRRSVKSALEGHFTIGADATVTAGPVGRQATIGTDIKLASEIYSYSRSRGIFLGAAVDGCRMDIDYDAGTNYYAHGVPDTAQEIIDLVKSYTQTAVPVPESAPAETPLAEENGVETLRALLHESNTKLQSILSPQWQTWLALPQQLAVPNAPKPPLEDLIRAQERFRIVSESENYAELSAREEFRTTYLLLNEYVEKY
ncbi:MAG: lipid-binding SYLF domain-containing protein [Planctomycetia bacterium]|nr:lipid-binding SYLF domain-containing protein [Planctomycetia bacterium]